MRDALIHRDGDRALIPIDAHPKRVAHEQHVEARRLAELRWVDEEAHHDRVALGPRCREQGAVPGVERAHRGHQADRAVADAEDPPLMAAAFARGVQAGRMAFLARMGKEGTLASASSPLTGFLYDE